MNSNYEVKVKSNTPWYHLSIKELYSYKDLVFLFVKRNFALIYKQTILGPLWLILSPFLTSVVFTFVFGHFAGLSTDGIPQILFYMSGNIIWGLFSSSTNNISKTFLENSNIFGKVYFPRLTVPISQAITSIVNFFIQFIMLIIFYIYFLITGSSVIIGFSLLLLPIVIIQAATLAMAVGIIISSLTVRYRDLAIAINFGMQLWMYITPVVYPLSSTNGIMRTVLLINPMTAIVNNFRYFLLGAGEFLFIPWLISLLVTIALTILGIFMFNKTEKTFIDTI